VATQKIGCRQNALACALQALKTERCAATAGDDEVVAIKHSAWRVDHARF
jgi:hypothetical protein